MFKGILLFLVVWCFVFVGLNIWSKTNNNRKWDFIKSVIYVTVVGAVSLIFISVFVLLF